MYKNQGKPTGTQLVAPGTIVENSTDLEFKLSM